MDGWKSSQYQNGLRALCKDVRGTAVAYDVAVIDTGLLTAWLIAHPSELDRLWDEMENERVNCNTRMNTLDAPLIKGNVAAMGGQGGGNV